MALLIRTERDPGTLSTPVREALRSFAPGLPVYLVRTMEDVRYLTTWEQRLFSHLFNAFAMSAVLLACLGIYGLVAYRVGRRTHEIGIRIALGAEQKDVLRLLLGQGAGLAAIGIGLGLLLSAGVGRLLASALYGVSSMNPSLYAAAAAVLVVPVLVASYVPARRAARIKPMSALRDE